MANCPVKSPERQGGDYTSFFFLFLLYLQILELEKKVVRQKQIAAKVEQANSSKRLQKEIETLELHLNNVSKRFADLWRPRAGPRWGLGAKRFLIRTKGSGANAFGCHKLQKGPGLLSWPDCCQNISKAPSSLLTQLQHLCHAKKPEGLHLLSDQTKLPEATLPWTTPAPGLCRGRPGLLLPPLSWGGGWCRANSKSLGLCLSLPWSRFFSRDLSLPVLHQLQTFCFLLPMSLSVLIPS